MAELLVLSEEAVRRALPLDELSESLTTALISLSHDQVSVPPRVAARSQCGGLLGAMPGYVPDLGLAAKLVSIYPANPERGLPAHQALVAVFDEATGAPVAVMGGTYITAMRTAMTAALAARSLARRSVSLAIIGAGAQGEAHLVAFRHLLDPDQVRIASRRASKAADLAGKYPGAVAVGSVREAVQGADIVCCCTDAQEAVLENEWVTPGMHVSSVGMGPELPLEVLGRSRVFVESRTATLPPPAGAAELQGRDPASLVEIGSVFSGRASGRNSDEEVTIFKSTGHAVEDIAAAAVVIRRAGQLGAHIAL